MWKLTILGIVCGGSCLLSTPAVWGQSPQNSGAAPQKSVPYYPAISAGPSVSPYLNLGTNANGLSNYQTLVRPLIMEREAIERQSVTLDRLNRQIQGAAATGDWREVQKTARDARSQRGGRFMNYSHYFGTAR